MTTVDEKIRNDTTQVCAGLDVLCIYPVGQARDGEGRAGLAVMVLFSEC